MKAKDKRLILRCTVLPPACNLGGASEAFPSLESSSAIVNAPRTGNFHRPTMRVDNAVDVARVPAPQSDDERESGAAGKLTHQPVTFFDSLHR
jgi:hypothetical protein